MIKKHRTKTCVTLHEFVYIVYT